MLHRPGPELARLTPRNNDSLLFDGIPWVGRAQEEHDAFAAALRERGVEVLYLRDLLGEAITASDDAGDATARETLVDAAVRVAAVGPSLYSGLRDHLLGLSASGLGDVVTAG